MAPLPFTAELNLKAYLGVSASRALGILDGGKMLASVEPGSAPLAKLQYIVFDGERRHRFSWGQINGTFIDGNTSPDGYLQRTFRCKHQTVSFKAG